MKRISILYLLIVPAIFLSVILTPVLVNAADKDKEKDEINLLKEKIEALEKKINKQENQIGALSKKIAEMKNPYLAVPKELNPNHLPKGSKPFKYQGQQYYMVPINSKPNENQLPK
jgi:peptidoglycan hydrolase CwlO-like protein